MKGRINQEFRKVGDVVREGDVVFEREWDCDFENRKSNDKSNVQS